MKVRVSGVRPAVVAIALFLTLAISNAPGVLASPTLNGFDLSSTSLPVDAIERGGPPRDGIPAIDAPLFVSARAAQLADDDRVLGVHLDGIARAYPVRILNWHEIVNDRFGERAIAVTYCPLCGTGIAFDAGRGPQARSFGVSGLLYNSDVLLYDRATESLWSQILRVAVSGRELGSTLSAVALSHTSWAAWRKQHPDTEVLSTQTGYPRDYKRDPYAGYGQVQRLMFDVQHRDERFGPKEWVIGVTIDGKSKAWPFSLLEQEANAEGVLEDTVGGEAVSIRYDREHRSAEAFDARGTPIAATTAFWFAWVAFHPNTEVLVAR